MEPIRVNLDITSLIRINLFGIGMYTFNLYKALAKRDDLVLTSTYKVSRYSHKEWIDLHLPNLNPEPYIPVFSDLKKQNWDVYHGPDFLVPNKKDVAKVVTIHDMGVFHRDVMESSFVEEGQTKLKKSLRKHQPDHIIVVSDFVKKELLKEFPEFQGKVTRIYHGMDHIVKPIPDNESTKPDRPYILYLGTLEKRKNLKNLILAFEQFNQLYPEIDLFLVGGFGFGAEKIISLAQRSPAANRIHYKGYVKDHDRGRLYKNALFAVYPSLYEGFGMPILEAMYLGCPILTSNIGAMDEVSGDAALKADPLNPDSIAAQMVQLAQSEQLRNDYIAKGSEHVSGFTWQKAADETVQVYRNAMFR